jgi:DNA-binding CsgD family transcriptional regulator
MPTTVRSDDRLQDRREERAALDGLISRAREGHSGVIVLRGQPGVGKTALLDHVLSLAAGCRVIRASGVESEMELAFAGLHQLCGPLLGHLDRLPAPQRDALGTAFGLRSGDPPDRFLVGLAVLSLLSESAEQQPLVCLLDDAQWLDRASAQVLGFVARRLGAEAVAMVFAIRDVEERELAGLTELTVGPLRDVDARALLASVLPGKLDVAVRDRVIAEARGNPLALLELPRGWTPAALAGGFGLPAGVSVSGRIEESFRRRLTPLPDSSKRLLLVAAAEPVGDPGLVWAAATRLEIDPEAADPAVAAGLLEAGTQLRFRHPLVRSVVYGDAADEDRRTVHAALAEATDAVADPDRRAWHRAQATLGPDEDVAAELERSAGRAQARGGVAAAAAFLQRAAALTRDPDRRADRALAAAYASLETGAFQRALAMLDLVETASPDELRRAQIHLLRAQVASTASFGRAAAELVKAGKEIEPLDGGLARATYLNAWGAALAAGEPTGPGSLREVSLAAGAALRPNREPDPNDLLLEGLARLVTDGLEVAAPILRLAVSAFRVDDRVLQSGTMAASAAAALWDMPGFEAVIARQLQLARDAGALALLAQALQGAGIVATLTADLGRAASLVAEADAVTAATGVRISSYGGMLLAAYRGRDARTLFETAIDDASGRGEGLGVQYAHWAMAVLANGVGRYEDALAAARRASTGTPALFVSDWGLVELVEAAARTGDPGLAVNAAARLTERTAASESDWGLGVAARAKALTMDGDAAAALYVDAIARLGRTPLRGELARANLLYGEWLRRHGRRVEAREQLRAAHEVFDSVGMEAFANRARVELLATGEHVRSRAVATQDQLTPQEEQIARLARDGLSNAEISAQLFLSPRTIEWHLRKVFAKLEISSRRDLRTAFPGATERVGA